MNFTVIAYHGYLIKETLHGFEISKDGFHIGWANTSVEAKVVIDKLTL